MASNAERVRALQAAGWTQRQIADALGRSPSYVSRVARGLTPGRLVGPSLRALQAGLGTSIPPAPRRARRTGEPARVRQPRGVPALPPMATAGVVTDAQGRQAGWRVIAWAGADGVLRDLRAGERAPHQGEDVSRVVVHLEGVGARTYIGPFDNFAAAARQMARRYKLIGRTEGAR